MPKVNVWEPDVAHYDTYNGKVGASGKYIMKPMNWLGHKLAIMKSTEGTGWIDPAFVMQWAAAGEVKIPRIAYHFFRSNLNAIQQAEHMKRVVMDNFTSNDYIAADFETVDGVKDGTTRLMALGSFLYEMEKVVPVDRIFIYTGGPVWAAANGLTATWAARYRLWIAHWPWDNYFLGIKLPPYFWTETQLNTYKAKIESGMQVPDNYKPFNGKLAPWGDNFSIWQWTAKCAPGSIPGYPSDATKIVVDYNAVFMDLPGVVTTPPTHPTICPTCGQTWPE